MNKPYITYIVPVVWESKRVVSPWTNTHISQMLVSLYSSLDSYFGIKWDKWKWIRCLTVKYTSKKVCTLLNITLPRHYVHLKLWYKKSRIKWFVRLQPCPKSLLYKAYPNPYLCMYFDLTISNLKNFN